MTTITPVSTASPQTGTQQATASSDYQTFLRMLTVQMQNQDPLNPIESSDYAVQLATFSGVEQQVRTNQLLASLASQFGVMGMAQMAGWVGQEARAAAPVWMDGDPVTLSPNPAAAADRVVLVVRDSEGTLVAREDLPVSADPYQWLGADAEGNPLPDGVYSLELESYAGEDLLGTSPVEAYARIAEVRGSAGTTVLVLEGGVEIAATDVTALRQPGG